MRFKALILLLCCLFLSCVANKSKKNVNKESGKNLIELSSKEINPNFPPKEGIVIDLEKIFSDEEKISLQELITDFEIYTENRLVVISLDTIIGASFKNYSIALANYWNKTYPTNTTEVVISFSTKYREMRIEINNDILSKFSSLEAKKIIDNQIIPRFKEEKYFEGIKSAILKISEYFK